MVNLTGKNGVGVITYPPDADLKSALLFCVKNGFSQDKKLAYLAQEDTSQQKHWTLKIGLSNLNKIERRLEIPSARRLRAPAEVETQAIIDEVERDLQQNNGPNYVKTQLQLRGMIVPRDAIRAVMNREFPMGAQIRYPGRKKSQVFRTPLAAFGPYHEISADGHEKLGAQALQMGGVGLPIYALKDKWTAELLKMDVVPNDRTNAAIGHLFLDFVAEKGGIGMQMTMDKGSEIGWMVAIQDTLRAIYAPGIDPDIHPSHACVKSIHNTIIEAFWRWLKMKRGLTLREHILRGKLENIFSPMTLYHKHLFNWIFPPLVQAELDDFRNYWNHHQIRFQREKIMPSGHVPRDAALHPAHYGGIDCFIRVPASTVSELREVLTEEVGPREQHLAWVTAEFDEFAVAVYESLGKPKITLESSWSVFARMSEEIEGLALAYRRLGLLEYLNWVEDLAAVPILGVWDGISIANYSELSTWPIVPEAELQPYIDDVLAELEFITGDAKSTEGGKLRASLGREEPYALRFIEIGNEDFFQADTYAAYRWQAFTSAIEGKYPGQFEFLATSLPDTTLTPAYQRIDFHQYNSPSWFTNNSFMFDEYPRNGSKWFVGEYAVTSTNDTNLLGDIPSGRLPYPTLQGAAAEAAFMTGMERNSDVVFASAYAPSFQHIRNYQWTPDIITYDAMRMVKSTSYYVQQMFSLNKGTHVLSTVPAPSTDTVPLFWAASYNNETDVVFLKVSNTGPTDLVANIFLSTPATSLFASAVSLSSPPLSLDPVSGQFNVSNTLEKPHQIIPVSTTFALPFSDRFNYTFPASSVTVLSVMVAEGAVNT
ncbi:hypothetical protein MKEN_01247400 [Mycena kentingensis (nom. inval.)]|nr:hypothetical protein MKEN_01247400 [Mycena kentingensis (nom. inval.)]